MAVQEPLYFSGSSPFQQELSRLLALPLLDADEQVPEKCTLIAEAPSGSLPPTWLSRRPQVRLILCCSAEPDPAWLELPQLHTVFLPPIDLQEVARSLGARPPVDPAHVAARVWQKNRHIVDQSLAILGGQDLAQARLHAHRLAGSLGSFGLSSASQVARTIEDSLLQSPPACIAGLVEQLRRLIEEGPQPQSPGSDPKDLRRLQVITLLSQPEPALLDLAQELDFELLEVRDIEEARRWVCEREPEIALVQTEHRLFSAWTRLLQQHREFAADHLALFWVPASGADVAGQLAHCYRNVRVGPDPASVVCEIRRQIEWLRRQMFQVAVVDDDEVALTAVRYVLQSRRLQVRSWEDPLDFWRNRHQANFDLIILDLDMPRLSGYEICRALRKDPHFQERAIFMLTAHNDADTVTRLFRVGADDFVAKPFLGPELRSRVEARLERFRLLAQLIQSDPLTGLLNRRKAQQNLDRYLQLARRQRQPLSLALLDVDYFKKFNDEWGHAQGDEVLRSLAQRLREWFRQEDVVARWGGEEFLVAMYGIRREQAAQRLESLLQSLLETPLIAQLPPVTFSAGVSELVLEAEELETALELADQRLYAAKKAGRRRVVSQPPLESESSLV